MDIHEFQAKLLLRHYGIAVPNFHVIESLENLLNTVNNLQIDSAAVKVQVHAGGRGKAGGVKIAKTKEDVLRFGKSLFGMHFVNHQTGPRGVTVNKLMLTDLVNIARELYISIIIDRKSAKGVVIISPEGGMDIEEVALKSPEKILKLPITAKGSLHQFQLLRLVNFIGWKGTLAEQGKALVLNLIKMFIEIDASLIEINPLVETVDGVLTAVDAKVSIDDNALFRQAKIKEFDDPSQIPSEEVQAKLYDLAYVALDGNIGCMVNGAGLAMATMDMIHLSGGKPANFLDVGGGASEEKVAAAFKIILSDPKVKGVFINIFGGIMNCETLALGLTSAAKDLNIQLPIVIRMEGTNVEEGKKILLQSGLNMTIAETLTEAADKIVALSSSGV